MTIEGINGKKMAFRGILTPAWQLTFRNEVPHPAGQLMKKAKIPLYFE